MTVSSLFSLVVSSYEYITGFRILSQLKKNKTPLTQGDLASPATQGMRKGPFCKLEGVGIDSRKDNAFFPMNGAVVKSSKKFFPPMGNRS